jgi:diaminopimelate decarboxylase
LKENKFGVSMEDAVAAYQRAAESSHLEVTGIDCHIGSQLTEIAPFVDALDRVLALIDKLDGLGIKLKHLDMGGGLGIRYRDEKPPEPAEHAAALVERLRERELEILIEPGRAIAGNAGILITQVLYLKHNEDKNFAIVDAAMNDLMRPALYQAWQEIIPLKQPEDRSSAKVDSLDDSVKTYDVVGPVCETGDFLGKNRDLVIEQGDYLVVRSAGAYGFSMSSNYNTRPRAAEVMVDGEKAEIVRKRETIEQLFQNEVILS